MNILFVYNRPSHTRRTLEALSQNKLTNRTKLYFYCDGPQENACDGERREIEAVREVIREFRWPGEVQVVESTINKEAYNAIIGTKYTYWEYERERRLALPQSQALSFSPKSIFYILHIFLNIATSKFLPTINIYIRVKTPCIY